MKKLSKYFLLLLIIVSTVSITTSCDEKEDDLIPEITFIRVTDPEKADSLISGSLMGKTIAIIGINLEGLQKMWFNDVEANLNPTFITSTTVLVTVPSSTPTEKNDKMTMQFKNGYEYIYDFIVDIPGPVFNRVKCEFVPDGELLYISGAYFYDPVVTFPNGLLAEITENTDTKIVAIVPEGSGSGEIKIETLFGSCISNFTFRDPNVFIDFERGGNKDGENWTGVPMLAAENPNPAGCSGDYMALKGEDIGAWRWENYLLTAYWSMRNSRGSISFIPTGNPNNIFLKFEVNVVNPWSDIPMEIAFGTPAENNTRDAPIAAIYNWKPWVDGVYQTDGWVTVEIPISEFTGKTSDWSAFTDITFMLFGAATENQNVFIGLDNIRFVVKE